MGSLDDKTIQLLKENKYEVTSDHDVITIKNKSFGNLITVILSVILGLIFLLFGATTDGKLLILGLLLLGVPFTYGKWRFPRKITIDWNNNFIIFKKNFIYSRTVDLEKLEGVHVERHVRSSHVSAFEVGNKDYIYSFFIQPALSKRQRFLRIQFRKECDAEMIELATSFSEFFNIK